MLRRARPTLAPPVSLLLLLLAALPPLAGCTAAAPRQADEACPATASRLPDKDSCPAGRAYSRDALERTGAASTADALRRLDPAITVHPHP